MKSRDSFMKLFGPILVVVIFAGMASFIGFNVVAIFLNLLGFLTLAYPSLISRTTGEISIENYAGVGRWLKRQIYFTATALVMWGVFFHLMYYQEAGVDSPIFTILHALLLLLLFVLYYNLKKNEPPLLKEALITLSKMEPS